MNSRYCFTAIEDQLLLALRDQGHYNWDFIKRVHSDRAEWTLIQRYYKLHKGLSGMDPSGEEKRDLSAIQKAKMLRVRHGWTLQKDEELQMLHSRGNDWLEISYELSPHNGLECLNRWLILNPDAKYPYKTEMDTNWRPEEVKKLVSMGKEGRSWGEIAEAISWDQTTCRKYWFSHYWYTFIYWFPDGRNFRDRPQYWQQKVRGQPYEYDLLGQNMQDTAEPRDEDCEGEREREREDEYVKKMDQGQLQHKADLNGDENVDDTAELNDEDAEGETDDEYKEEICKRRDRKEEIVEGADHDGKEERHKDNATRLKNKIASEDAKTSEEDAERENEILDAGEARWMLEQAEDEKNSMIRASHAFERQSFCVRIGGCMILLR